MDVVLGELKDLAKNASPLIVHKRQGGISESSGDFSRPVDHFSPLSWLMLATVLKADRLVSLEEMNNSYAFEISDTSIRLKGAMNVPGIQQFVETVAQSLETLEYPTMVTIDDSSVFQRMEKLRTLSLPAGTVTGNVDRHTLSNLTSLEIQQDQNFDASDFRQYASLTSLSLIWYATKLDLFVLAELPSLTQLEVTGFSALRDEHISPLTGLTSLAICMNKNLTDTALMP